MEENKKKNKGLIVLVILLIMCVLGLCGYVIYISFLKTKDNKIDNNTSATKTTITTVNQENIEEHSIETAECDIKSVKGTNISLKNQKNDNGRITTDVYINNNYSSNISYYTSPYNDCESIDVEEIDDDYFLIRFANEAAMFTNFYLFNKNGKFVTNFENWYKKYDSNVEYLLWVGKNENGGLSVNYYSDWFETSIDSAYCEAKAKPEDNYSIEENVSIVNGELKTDSVKKTTWKEKYLCKDGNTEYCGNINDVICE